jgi:transforming growth factor-beta-induced protein
LSACSDSSDLGNLAEVAQANGYSSLVAAIEKAGVGSTLTAPGAGLTVLAPSNAAFTTLAGQLGFADSAAMLAALSAADLARILQYHLLPGQKLAADLQTGPATQATAYSFSGAPATLSVSVADGVAIRDAVLASARVTTADISANNGVLHAIDKVLVPPGVLNIVQMAQANPGAFSSLTNAVVATGLAANLSGPGPLTVFAPTNTAFAAAPGGLTTAQLTSVLTYHVLSGQVLSTGIPFGTPVPTLDTTTLAGATVAAQTITINADLSITDTTAVPARITAVDVRASNGVIHVIDKVLLPN